MFRTTTWKFTERVCSINGIVFPLVVNDVWKRSIFRAWRDHEMLVLCVGDTTLAHQTAHQTLYIGRLKSYVIGRWVVVRICGWPVCRLFHFLFFLKSLELQTLGVFWGFRSRLGGAPAAPGSVAPVAARRMFCWRGAGLAAALLTLVTVGKGMEGTRPIADGRSVIQTAVHGGGGRATWRPRYEAGTGEGGPALQLGACSRDMLCGGMCWTVFGLCNCLLGVMLVIVVVAC